MTVTASYTNQAGTSGRTTTSVNFWSGGLGQATVPPTANQVQFLPLQSGDYGVRAVASVTLSASTLTAGNFGVFLFKPLATTTRGINSAMENDYIIQTSSLPEIQDSAYLGVLMGFTSAAASITSGYLDIVQV